MTWMVLGTGFVSIMGLVGCFSGIGMWRGGQEVRVMAGLLGCRNGREQMGKEIGNCARFDQLTLPCLGLLINWLGG